MKVGIAGTGFMGTTHAAGWAETPADLVGLVDEVEELARPLAERYGLKIYPSLKAMLKEVDVVDICTPTHLHCEMVLQAAAARKHIICEKPLSRTVSQGHEMLKACEEAGVRLLPAQVVRYFPEYAQAKQVVMDGMIGKVGVVRLTRGSYRPKKSIGNWFLDEEKSGGILMDLMIHDFDYARWIAGEVTSVFARNIGSGETGSGKRGGDLRVDYGLAILRHENGALSHVAGAWAYPPPTFRTGFEIAGDAGLIEYDSEATAPIKNLILKSDGEDAPDVAIPASPTSESPYTTQIKEFYRALQDGTPARISAEDGLKAVQIAEAAIQSARSGKPVEIEKLREAGA